MSQFLPSSTTYLFVCLFFKKNTVMTVIVANPPNTSTCRGARVDYVNTFIWLHNDILEINNVILFLIDKYKYNQKENTP